MKSDVIIEVVASTVQSCIEAQAGGASRIELCSALGVAGITPSSGLLEVVKRHVRIPIYVMIRPREGNFTYSHSEVEVMMREIDLLGASGADGFVFGALQDDSTVDIALTKALVKHCSGAPVTFHRAIDCTPNIFNAIEEIASCGCERILTSGGKSTSAEGIETILMMVEKSQNSIFIMPGGGIRLDNFASIYHPSITEYHLSGRSLQQSSMQSDLFEMDWSETTREAIARVVAMSVR